jgi:transposase
VTQVENKSRNAKLTKQAVALYSKGKSIREISEKIECSYGKTHRLLTDAGVELRPRGGSRSAKK